MRITDVLVQRGLLTAEQLAEVLRRQQAEGARWDRAIVQLGYLHERAVLAAVGEHLHLRVVDLSQVIISPEVLRLLPAKLVFRKRLLPIAREDGTIEVATSDAFDTSGLDEVRLVTGLEVRPVLAPADEIEKPIKAHYGVGGDTIDEMVAGELGSGLVEAASNEDLLDMAQEASVIKLVNELIIEAVNERASDIHIEPYERDLAIRYRIDGVLHAASLPAQIARAGLREADFTRIPVGRRRLPGAEEVGWTIQGEGPLARLLDLLFLLQSEPRLHRLEGLALSPVSKGAHTRIRLRYVSLALTPAPEIPTTNQVAQLDLETPARRRYDAITRRDLFRPFIAGESAPPPLRPHPPWPQRPPRRSRRISVWFHLLPGITSPKSTSSTSGRNGSWFAGPASHSSMGRWPWSIIALSRGPASPACSPTAA